MTITIPLAQGHNYVTIPSNVVEITASQLCAEHPQISSVFHYDNVSGTWDKSYVCTVTLPIPDWTISPGDMIDIVASEAFDLTLATTEEQDNTWLYVGIAAAFLLAFGIVLSSR